MKSKTEVWEDIMNKSTLTKKEKTRTSATVTSTKLAIFKVVAGLKYEKDPMNSAWEEAVTLFLKNNEEYLKGLNIEIKDLLKED